MLKYDYIAEYTATRFKRVCNIALIFILAGSMHPAVWAQANKNKKSDPALTVAGKPLTSIDSLMVRQLFFTAIREKAIENIALAKELFNRVLQADPANDAAMYELANLDKKQNNYEEALQLLEKAVTIKPDNEWYWVALSDSYEKSNQIDKLENVFNELIRINPNKPDYYFDKANVCFLQGRYDEALAVYKQLEEKTGLTDDLVANRQKIYLKQGKINQAAAEMEELIAANPQQIRYYLLLAEIYNSNTFADKALQVLQRAEKVDAGNGLVHLALADIYRDKKNNDACYTELKLAFAIPDVDPDQKIKIVLGYIPKFPDPDAKASALELSRILAATHPGNAKAQALLGDMLAQNDKLSDAKLAYQKSISLDKEIYGVQEQLIRIELGTNALDDAIKDGENALSYFPNQAWLNYLVGVAWMQKKNYTKALGYIKNATSLESQDKDLLGSSYSALGDCYHSLGNNKNSDSSYEKALSYNPDNAYTLNNYAYYLSLRNEQLDKAAAMSDKSNTLQPNTASFEDTYAWILFKQKKYADAKIWIEKALLHDKDHSAVQTEHYGDIMFYLGDTGAAVQNWKKAKQYGARSPVLERKINERKYIE